MTRRPWPAWQDALLREFYPRLPSAELARVLRRSLRATYHRAGELGLRKHPDYLRAHAARFDGLRGSATRFRPGQVPWNKGMKGLRIGGKQTQFQPGQLSGRAAQLAKPLGALRLCAGVLQQKIGTAAGAARLRWTPVHRLVWEAAHGPVAPGYIVRFREGQHTTELSLITLERLECVSRAEHMRRNSYHRYPREIARLIQLRGALNRQINRRTSP